jgi:hypothetical protein
VLKQAALKAINVHAPPRSIRREPVEEITAPEPACPAKPLVETDVLGQIDTLRVSIERARGMVRCVIGAARHGEALSADIADALERAYRRIRDAEDAGKSLGDFVKKSCRIDNAKRKLTCKLLVRDLPR